MRLRAVSDFTPSVLDAWCELLREIENHVGEAPRFNRGPVWVVTDTGDARRVSATWFLSLDGQLINHCVSLHEYGRGPVGAAPAVPRSWLVGMSRHAGPVKSVELLVTEPPDLALLRHVAGYALLV